MPNDNCKICLAQWNCSKMEPTDNCSMYKAIPEELCIRVKIILGLKGAMSGMPMGKYKDRLIDLLRKWEVKS